ncbi:hypothetical protein [Eubacterium sp. An11]|nr:hypothetical protein [Eubacterium sp. An11]
MGNETLHQVLLYNFSPVCKEKVVEKVPVNPQKTSFIALFFKM